MSAGAQPMPRVGMPMLSGPPPISESSNCRQCSKSFNILTRRAHACGHCGYEYCPSCIADGQALMPRRPTRPGSGQVNGSSANGNGSGMGSGMGRIGAFFSDIADTLGLDEPASNRAGYDPDKVCTRCLGMLQVTSAPIERVRTLPIKRLKEYLSAYNIPVVGPKEKEDFVQAAVKARNPTTGCLSPESESYYRRHSVPSGSTPNPPNGRTNPSTARPPPPQPPPAHAGFRPEYRPSPARPPHAPTSNPYTTVYRPSPANAHSSHAHNAQSYNHAHTSHTGPHAHRPPPPQAARPPHHFHPSRPPSATAAGRSSPAPAPAAKPGPPPPPVPTILSLVSLPRSYLSSMSIGTLKAILYENHVRVDFKQVLEKEELVGRVWELVSAERRRLERQRYEEEREAHLQAEAESQARARQAASAPAAANGAAGEGVNGHGVDPASEGGASDTAGDGVGAATSASPPGSADPVLAAAAKPAPTGPMPEIERGLCVVCQDEEATLAVVDCGHLCMCAPCSDLVMATSKECPLCRTRIVTSHRLIRIYKV